MRILLILPRDTVYRYRGLASKLIGPYAPLTLATLAALVPEELGAHIDLVDEGVQQPHYADRSYDVVGITCVAPTANRAYALAEYWRSQGAFVVLGGAHPTLMPEEAQQHANAVVIGLAEETWPQLLRDLKRGAVKNRYHAEYTGELSCPVPRRDLMPRFGYLPAPTVIANRGCNNHCFYCVVNQGNYARCVVRPMAEVVNEIRDLHARHLLFLDPNPLSNREYAKNLFEALIPLKLKWMALAPSDVIYDRELFELFVRSGCEGLMLGLESFSQDSLDESGKTFSRVRQYKEIVKTLHAHRIVVSGCFVLGFDSDTPAILNTMAETVYDLEIDFPRYGLLTPFPGTLLFDQFKRNGRLITEDWSFYDSQRVVFQPKHMSPTELQQIFDNTLKQTYSFRHIFRRVQTTPHSKLLGLMANLGMRAALLSPQKAEAQPDFVVPALEGRYRSRP
jgi:radical SAM superfamily enzyme YgiQ (UPF0313 family)